MALAEPLSGGCQCGAIRYEVADAPLALFVCHCTECRRQSASAFGISVIVAQAAWRVVRGEPHEWSRPTDAGNTLDCAFCPACGTRLWHRRRGATDTVSIKGGSLDAPVDLAPAVHIWTSRKLPGIVVPAGAVQFPFEPDQPRPEADMTQDPIATWHRLLATRDVAGLDRFLAADAVFHSPVVHRPQAGRALVAQYLAAAFAVFGNDSFRYVREVRGERDAALEFEVEIDGVHVNGIDLLRWNDAGEVVDFKVMLRPLKAVNLVHEKMAAILAAAARPA